MIVAILSGEATLDALRGNRCKYVSNFFRMFPTKYGNLSLDAPLPGSDDDKRTLQDVMRVEESNWRSGVSWL
jgi:hypothetical protein